MPHTISVAPSTIGATQVAGVAVNLDTTPVAGAVELRDSATGEVVDSKPITANPAVPVVGLSPEGTTLYVAAVGPFAITQIGPTGFQARYAP